jgi:predicted dehydrogenase
MSKVGIGFLGCGNVSTQYLEHMPGFDQLEVVACADLDADRARARGDEFGISACSPAELLADPAVEIVVNLTPPLAHRTVSIEVIQAGKHLYTEKPLAPVREDAAAIIAAAREHGVLVAGAPDTFLGGALQTCRKLIDDGAIGRPVAAFAAMLETGPELWHPEPRFFYGPGGGPLMDMSPYYLTALISLLGPIARVSGSTSVARPRRRVTSEPLNGSVIEAEVPTHAVGILDFERGAIASMAMSWEVAGTEIPRLEVHGTDGSLSAPDPNFHGGPVRLRRPGSDEWESITPTHDCEVGRGTGVADMAEALRTGRPPRASGEMLLHVVDAMCSITDSSESGRRVDLTTTCPQPEPRSASLTHRGGINDG